MPATVRVKCERCKEYFWARVADRDRGWGRFCSKRCKAIKQTYGKASFRSETIPLCDDEELDVPDSVWGASDGDST